MVQSFGNIAPKQDDEYGDLFLKVFFQQSSHILFQSKNIL